MGSLKIALFGIAAALVVASNAFAQNGDAKPFVAPIFSDNMVLQRGQPDPIWGWSVPGDKITVSMDRWRLTVTAGPDGHWLAKLPSLPAGGPHTLTVSGAQKVVFSNVVEGEVWICSGQSNMEFGVGNLDNADQVIAAANHPEIRLNVQQHQISSSPCISNSGSWLVCSPDSIKQGTWNGFTAVGYFFGLDLYQSLKVPIGLIESNYGGTVAEAWTSADALRKNLPEFDSALDQEDAPAQPGGKGNIGANTPSSLFNGMIAPLIPYGIRGVVWYQGDSNAGRSKQYRVLLPTLITDWRQRWNEGPFAFDIVQLNNYGQNTQPGPDGDGLQEIRDAQMFTADTTPNTGIAVTDDLGNGVDMHPKDKADVGKRLSLVALAQTYGQKIVSSGPIYMSSTTVGNEVIISFDHVDGALVVKGGGALTGFSISDIHGNWYWADAKIDGDRVIVSSPSVSSPTAVLFAWADNPTFNLYNGAGLPAAPFRTDRPVPGAK